MEKLNIAIIGFERVGRACALALSEADDLVLAGVVRHLDTPKTLPDPFSPIPMVTHVRDLKRVDRALVCVPANIVLGVVRELLQARIPIIECAILEEHALKTHYEAIDNAAHHHGVPAMVGAGWNPGILPLFERAFAILIPDGHTTHTNRPGASLHLTEAVERIQGVKGALTTETRDAEGQLTRYVYVEIAKGTTLETVEAELATDPLFVGERTLVFEVESIAALEEEGRGILLELTGTERTGAHAALLIEARFDVPTFTARIMRDAARRMTSFKPGAHCYSL